MKMLWQKGSTHSLKTTCQLLRLGSWKVSCEHAVDNAVPSIAGSRDREEKLNVIQM
jgi:hypothetical protein